MSERAPSERPSVLGELSNAQPAQAVQRRVVRGALARARGRKHRHPAAWLFPATALAGAVALAWVALWQPASLRATKRAVPAMASGAPAATPAPEPAQEVWQAKRTPLRVSLGRHRLLLGRASRVHRLSGDPGRAALRVEQGRVEFAVHPLRRGQSFQVRTAHLGVRVVGTRFSVEVDGVCTRVEVAEGIVSVTPAAAGMAPARLHAGQGRTHCASPERLEELTAGEALVREALELRRSPAQARRALALLSRYLRRYPEGSFAEEALYHSILLHERLGEESAARVLGRRFLARFSDTHRATRLRDHLRRKKAALE